MKTDDFKYPCKVVFRVKWDSNKHRAYTKKIFSQTHLESTIEFYENRGGKVLDVEKFVLEKRD